MATEVVDGVFDITSKLEESGKRYRVFLFTEGTPTLIDAGLEESVDNVIDEIDEIGVTPERLVITHGDGDHVGGFDALVEEYDPETWMPELTTADVETEPDHRYEDGDTVDRFTAVHAPGHEPDNHALVDEDTGIAVMGDALSGADQRGLEEGRFHIPPAYYSKDLNQAEESLERLLEFEFDVGLVFHGSSVTEDAVDKIDRYVNFPGK